MAHSMNHGGMEGTGTVEPAPEMPMDHSMHMGHGTRPETGADDKPGNAPPPPVPTDRAADTVFPADRMEQSRKDMLKEMTFRTFALQIDQAEYRARSGKDGYGRSEEHTSELQ